MFFAVQGANLQLAFVLLQDAFVVIFPELLGGIFAANSLENCICQDIGCTASGKRSYFFDRLVVISISTSGHLDEAYRDARLGIESGHTHLRPQ